jgi:hypothetical protein
MMPGMDEELAIIRRPGGDRGAKRAAWQRVLEHWRQSGLGVTAFCRRHELPCKRFFKWRQKLEPASPSASGFVELQSTPDLRSTNHLEIQLGAARVLLPFDGSPGHLVTILQAIREAAC